MTFAEYNTDENFDNKNGFESSLEELVKIGKSEGKSKDEIKSSLSPKWQKSSKMSKFDEYYGEDLPKSEEKVIETPKEEPLKETTEIEVENKTEAPKPKTNTLDKKSKEYMTKQDEIADTGLNTVLNDVEGRREYNWEQTYGTLSKAGEAFNRIDDKLVAQIPTFVTKRYMDGEFGDPKSTDAKLRLAHFLVNGVASKLKQASNIAMRTAGKAPMFDDTTSDYEKYQQSNFAKGMENRWRKYEAETQNAIDLVTKEGQNEQEARLAAEKLTNDEKLGTRFKMMSAREKADLITIKMEIGKLVGKMDLSEIADFMTGKAINGDLTKDEAIAIGVAQLVKKSPQLLKKLPDGDYKTAILGLFGGGSVDSIIASLEGDANNGEEKPDNSDSLVDEKKTNSKLSNPSGNLKGYKALDGNTYDFNTFENKAGKQKLIDLINDLSKRFYNGEIDAETFRKHYNLLSGEASKHLGIKVENVNNNLKKNVNQKLKDLNTKTKNGEVTVDEYKAGVAKVLDMANDAGMTESEIIKLKKDFMNENKIKYKGKK